MAVPVTVYVGGRSGRCHDMPRVHRGGGCKGTAGGPAPGGARWPGDWWVDVWGAPGTCGPERRVCGVCAPARMALKVYEQVGRAQGVRQRGRQRNL